MYSRDSDHEKRKLNYQRYKKLCERGYSISEETASTALYMINEDPFGRAYYQKSLGEVAVRDPLTGREFTQEEWATKEFIVDNKTQLIAKVSADLVCGKKLSITFPKDQKPSPDDETWLEAFLKKHKLHTVLYEAAIRNSALGDQFFEVCVAEDEIEIPYRDPFFVYIEHDGDKVTAYELCWEIEIKEEIRRLLSKEVRKRTLVQKKIHLKGKIRYELWEIKGADTEKVPMITNPANVALVEKALTSSWMECYLVKEGEIETETTDVAQVYVIEENTGIDAILVIHWPNYRMFDIYGVSDAGMIEGLQNALNLRETQMNDVLDKHADPAMYGPDDFLDPNGNLVMTGGGGRYFPVSTGATGTSVGYLEWQGHLDDAKLEIERIYKAILDNTETAAALLGIDSGGVESGRALMYKLIRSLAMATRKFSYMKQALIDLISTAQKMRIVWIDGPGVTSFDEELTTDWKDQIKEPTIEVMSSLPTDVTESITQVTSLVGSGLISKETGLEIIAKLFDEIDIEQEKKRLDAQEKKDLEKQLAQFPDWMAAVPTEEGGEGTPAAGEEANVGEEGAAPPPAPKATPIPAPGVAK